MGLIRKKGIIMIKHRMKFLVALTIVTLMVIRSSIIQNQITLVAPTIVAQAASKNSAPVITVKALSNSEITINWKAIKNADMYDVYRSTSKNKGFKLITNVTENNYTDVDLKEQTTYYYKVDANVHKSTGGSVQTSYSAVKGATTKKNSFITIKGTKYSIYEKTLELSSMELTDRDIVPLKSMKQLEYIVLDHNKLTDISPLKEIDTLRTLDISNNQISDLSPLAKKDIDSLNISNNKISDISVISEFQKLEFISASNNTITDLAPLKKLKKLTTIYVDSVGTQDASVFSGKTELELLHIYGKVTNLSDIAAVLKNYKQFRDLGLFSSGITDFLSLKQVKTLKYLSIDHKSDDMNIDELRDVFPELVILSNDEMTTY